MGEALPVTGLQNGVREAEDGDVLEFLEAVEVELADEAGDFVVAEVGGEYFEFESVPVEDVDFGFGLIELHDCLVVLVLGEGELL